jgi:hypothetical protein
MKNVCRILVVSGIVLSLSSANSYAVPAGNSTANASANVSQRVLAALTMTSDRDMSFADVSQGASAFTVNPSDAASAEFVATGEPDHAVTITFPDTYTLTGTTDATKTLVLASTTSDVGLSGATTNTLGDDGHITFHIGATRPAIASNTVNQTYTGTITATITYP